MKEGRRKSWREGSEGKELKGGSLRDARRGLDRGRELDGVRMGKKGGAGNLEGRREGPVVRVGGS